MSQTLPVPIPIAPSTTTAPAPAFVPQPYVPPVTSTQAAPQPYVPQPYVPPQAQQPAPQSVPPQAPAAGPPPVPAATGYAQPSYAPPAYDPDDPFRGAKTADESFGGNYVEPGKHVFELKKAFIKISQNRRKSVGRRYFLVELLTLESTAHPIGSSRSWLVDFTKPGALGNIKNFGYALFQALGYSREQIDGWTDDQFNNQMKWVVGQQNPLGTQYAGTRLAAEAYHKPTEAGGLFTVVKWSPLAR